MKIRIAKTILCAILWLNIHCLCAQQSMGANEFVVGISYPSLFMKRGPHNEFDVYGAYGTTAETATTTSQGFPTSCLNQLKLDGFEVVQFFEPTFCSTSEAQLRTLIQLVKNNGMRFMPYTNLYFAPLSPIHNDNGVNRYADDGDPLAMDTQAHNKARPNYSLITQNIYSDPLLASTIYALDLGGEHNTKHELHYNTFPECANPPSSVYFKEIPPWSVSDAVGYFRTHIPASQKLVVGIVNHTRSIHDSTDDTEDDTGMNLSPVDHNPQEYAQLTNKPDVLLEGSYTQFPYNWYNQAYNRIYSNGGPNDPYGNVHYLSKFANIDYLRSKATFVHVQIDAERWHSSNESDYYYHYHSATVQNANWLWFQVYTSIIHRATGVWIYGFDTYMPEETVARDIFLSYGQGLPNRYALSSSATNYQSAHYKNFIAPMAREMAYLKRKGVLHSNSASVLFTKTDKADEFGVVPPAATYLANEDPEHRSEHYGLRYTIRTNGKDVYMIVSNPLNKSVTATLNFNGLGTPKIRNSTGIQILFESTVPTLTTVNSNTYKTIRNSNIDLTALTVGVSANYIYPNPVNRSINLAFGPMDVHVLKFISGVLPNHGNGWDNRWSNFGNGTIDSWVCRTGDKVLPADIDYDGSEEMILVQSENTNAWATIVKFFDYGGNVRGWYTQWANHGSGTIGNAWSIQQNDRFTVGDFNGDGREDLMCVRTMATNALMRVISYDASNQTWSILWDNNGNSAIGNGIYNARNALLSGNFIVDSADELFGVNGNIMSVFKLLGGQWVAIMSNGGNVNDQIYPYRNNLRVGDLNGDGYSDLLGMSPYWATVFNMSPSGSTWSTHWIWDQSTAGANHIGSWNYPLDVMDSCLIGNLDYDAPYEIQFIQTSNNPAWATTIHTNSSGGFDDGWSTYGLPPGGTPYIDDWPLQPSEGTSVRYFLVKPYAGQRSYLMAWRLYSCGRYLVSMYEPIGSNKMAQATMLDTAFTPRSDLSTLSVYPNPATSVVHVNLPDGGTIQADIYVLDAMGRMVLRTVVPHQSIEKLEAIIDVSDVDNGIYIVQMRSNGHILGHASLIVQH